MTNTISMPLTQAKSLASLINLADTTRNPVAPILGYVNVTGNGDTLTAVATDRYVAGAGFYALDDEQQTDMAFKLDADGAKFIKAIKANKYGSSRVTFAKVPKDERVHLVITFENSSVTVIQPTTGNYPPILDLINNLKDASEVIPVRFSLDKVAQINKLDPEDALDAWELTNTAGSLTKPGPVIFTNGNMKVVLQPNLRRP